MATKVKPSRIQSTWTPQSWDVPVYVDADSFQWWPNGAWDVRWPNSSTDWDLVLFDWTTWKAIQDSWKKLSDYQEKLTAQTAYTSQWTSSKVPQITTNSLWQVTWITEVNISYPSQVDDTAYANSWDWVTWTAPSKNAVYDKISAMDTTISWKQNALATQTAYTSQWDATKVPQITTNTLWQVTWITEVTITQPDISWKQDKATTWSTAPSSTPTYVWQQYIDTANDKLYFATGTSSSSDWTEAWSWSWSWDVTWPNSSTDGDIVLFDWATWKIIKDSGKSMSDVQSQHSTITVTLAAASWSSKTITVTATGVTASNTVFISPAPSSIWDYADWGIYCSWQWSWTLTFECDTEPTNDITVNVVIFN